jgi:hypothetical protein
MRRKEARRGSGFRGQSEGSSQTGRRVPTEIDYTLDVFLITYAAAGGRRRIRAESFWRHDGSADGTSAGSVGDWLCIAYVFWPQERVVAPVEKTRLDYLRERKGVVYDNLRDLNFEFRAGKFPEEDYARQRGDLEAEAAKVVTEMETLGG